MDNLEVLKNKFRSLGYDAYLFDTGKDAVEFLTHHLKDRTVGFGGSVTLQELGIYEALDGKAKELYWHWKTPEDKETRKKASTAQSYLLSANAVTELGEIVNTDGSGNRTSASIFGPEEVIFIIGKNKVVKTLGDAFDRIKTVAAPLNAKRLNKTTPCAKLGKCTDCSSPDCFCCVTVIHRRKPAAINATAVLINENLGY